MRRRRAGGPRRPRPRPTRSRGTRCVVPVTYSRIAWMGGLRIIGRMNHGCSHLTHERYFHCRSTIPQRSRTASRPSTRPPRDAPRAQRLTSRTEIDDLMAAFDNHDGPEVEEMRSILGEQVLKSHRSSTPFGS
jgi:hypothetical protein